MQDTPERFAALHAECHDGVYRYLHRRIAPAHHAEDLCDETFRIAWERLLSGKRWTCRIWWASPAGARAVPKFVDDLTVSPQKLSLEVLIEPPATESRGTCGSASGLVSEYEG